MGGEFDVRSSDEPTCGSGEPHEWRLVLDGTHRALQPEAITFPFAFTGWPYDGLARATIDVREVSAEVPRSGGGCVRQLDSYPCRRRHPPTPAG